MNLVAWLRGLGLERYAPAFRDNDVDGEVLPELTSDDLISIGVTSVGHRRKLLAAIAQFQPERKVKNRLSLFLPRGKMNRKSPRGEEAKLYERLSNRASVADHGAFGRRAIRPVLSRAGGLLPLGTGDAYPARLAASRPCGSIL